MEQETKDDIRELCLMRTMCALALESEDAERIMVWSVELDRFYVRRAVRMGLLAQNQSD